MNAHTIYEVCQNHCKEVDEHISNSAQSYAEPGYDDTSAGVLFGNWNNVEQRIQDVLERAGFSLEWDDEWDVCECGKAVRTQPDSHGWQPSYLMLKGGETVCRDCVAEDPAEYMEGKEKEFWTFSKHHPNEYGYTELYGEYERGFHPGQDDDPEKIKKEIKHEHYIFVLDSTSQFSTYFSVWYKEEEN